MTTPAQRNSEECVVTLDSDSAPRILYHGDDFICEDFPPGTRVIYPKPPIEGLPNREAAIRYALNHPEGTDPLHAQLKPGMKVTIALDDISLPLPPMQTPDIRQTMLEVVLDLLSAHGVDDIHLVIAICLHRRMTKAEMRRMVGEKIFNAFYPERYYNLDAEDSEEMMLIGETKHGEPVRLSKRAVDSDLVIYCNINLTPMDGGHKSVGVGLCDYETLRAHHEPITIRKSNSLMDPENSELARRCNRIGEVVSKHVNIFHIESVINTRMYTGQLGFICKREDEYTEFDRTKFEAMRWALKKLPRAAKRKMLHSIPAAYEMIGCYAGKTDPVHKKTLAKSYEQYAVKVQGQCDILVVGIPFISPYNVNSVLNPILVQVMALGYLHHLYRGKPLLRKGGVMIISHPLVDEFDHLQHPSYIEFFNRVLPETRDSVTLRDKYEREFAKNPSYIEMYRRGNAYHGAHPFFMWYWGEHGRQHVGKVIAAGALNAHVTERLGWERAATMTEAIAMAKSDMGSSAEITLLHLPPIVIADVE